MNQSSSLVTAIQNNSQTLPSDASGCLQTRINLPGRCQLVGRSQTPALTEALDAAGHSWARPGQASERSTSHKCTLHGFDIWNSEEFHGFPLISMDLARFPGLIWVEPVLTSERPAPSDVFGRFLEALATSTCFCPSAQNCALAKLMFWRNHKCILCKEN